MGNEFHGLVMDPSGSVLYSLSEDVGALTGSKGTTICRGDGSLVGEIRWKSRFGGPTYTFINGNRVENMFTKSRSGIFSTLDYNFVDDQGNRLYWKDLTVRQEDPSGGLY